MNIFKKITLINKLNKAINNAKKLADENKDLTVELRNIFSDLKNDFDKLVKLLPVLEEIKTEVEKTLKDVF